jgi:hypothetical protein
LKKIYYLLVLSLPFFLIACNNVNDLDDTSNSDSYNGSDLNIGVVGELPELEVDNVHFTRIYFNELENDVDAISEKFDSIFIMEDSLSEASQSQYAKVYSSLTIPTFFIKSKKSFIPFIVEDLVYEEVEFVKDLTYATGYLKISENEQKSWGFGLYNDVENEKNIKDVYNRIFKTINEVKSR